VIECAVQLRDAAKNQNDPFEEVWCVFDRDEHQKIDEALVRARDCKIRVAFSNPCFELWLLLHHEYTSAYLERDKAASLLKRHLPGYHKSTDVYDRLLPNQQAAIDSAQRLRQWHQEAGHKETENPSTRVDILVAELNALAGT
jgi:hypothetical protein